MKGYAMKFSILSFESPADFAARTDPAKKDAYWSGVEHYMKALKDAGVFAGGAGLLPPDTATTIRYRGGERLVQDGPYADTKEQLAGFFLIEVPSLDAALEWGARFPQQPGRVIEVRPTLVKM
jgi:hypothetical protein